MVALARPEPATPPSPLRRSPVAGAILDGVNAASLALMGVVTVELAGAAIVDPLTLALAFVSAVYLLVWRVNSSWLVLGGRRRGPGRDVIGAGSRDG